VEEKNRRRKRERTKVGECGEGKERRSFILSEGSPSPERKIRNIKERKKDYK